MRIPYQFRDVVLAALLLSCLAKVATAQQSAQQLDLPTLSPAVHSALYPEVMCVHCIVPQWDRGYILHLEIDKESAVVTMYVRDGKKVLEARPEPPDAAKVSLRRSIHAPGRNSRGWRRCHDGWAIQGFIADSHRIRFARRVMVPSGLSDTLWITAIRPTRIKTPYATIVLRRACSKVSFPSIPFPNHGTQL